MNRDWEHMKEWVVASGVFTIGVFLIIGGLFTIFYTNYPFISNDVKVYVGILTVMCGLSILIIGIIGLIVTYREGEKIK